MKNKDCPRNRAVLNDVLVSFRDLLCLRFINLLLCFNLYLTKIEMCDILIK